ncbi:uncharacterized protein C1orf131 homolog [Clupea harengus]|uniref:Uncharacterized protein C1orf131 homolog n=1 Tax=Clupea harengus TaxID=7950 RepID=A0A8M1KK57_CLUHA|nr:uncharacterized protein C1orf131 homolog [Clupea harengus]
MARNKGNQKGEEDVDQHFLDQVLNQIYDFGDGTEKRKTKKSQKKKKKRTHEEEIEEPSNIDSPTNSGINDLEDSDESLFTKNSVWIDSTQIESSPSATKHSNVKVVVFEDPLKKNKTKPKIEMAEEKHVTLQPPITKKRKKTEEEDDFSIEKARLEVHRFGITGYKKDQQRIFEQDRAIMLGARPPKKEYVNYKQYQQIVKEKKEKEVEEAKLDTSKKKKKGGKSWDKKPKSSSNAEPSGQIGRFKGGVLVLNSKQIQAMNGKIKNSK